MRRSYRYCIMMIVLSALAASWGCSTGRVATCAGPEDNPRLQYSGAMELIDTGDYQAATARLDRALNCGADFSPAYDGLAIIAARQAVSTPDPAGRAALEKRMQGYLKKANGLARTNEERLAHVIAVIRTQTAIGGRNFIETAKAAYRRSADLDVKESGFLYYDGKEAVDYYMGMAYREARDFQAAKDRFAAVLNAKSTGKWGAKADRAWKQTDNIVRATAGATVSDLGRSLAVRAVLSRAELTVLLTHELGPDALKPSPASGKANPSPIPVDIASVPGAGRDSHGSQMEPEGP